MSSRCFDILNTVLASFTATKLPSNVFVMINALTLKQADTFTCKEKELVCAHRQKHAQKHGNGCFMSHD